MSALASHPRPAAARAAAAAQSGRTGNGPDARDPVEGPVLLVKRRADDLGVWGCHVDSAKGTIIFGLHCDRG